MITSANICDIRTRLKAWRQRGETIAFVPTMGNLHQGHITLLKEAVKRADHVVASIFVNPLQFSQGEDLEAYPRTLGADQQALSDAGCELLFTPTQDIMYPKGLAEQTYVEVPGISDELCGQSRPGHFRGVATVVCKLFNLLQPDVALFGKKDFQQLLVIRTMVEDLSIPVEIVGIDTVRESSGLALSSRNGYLTPEEKQRAAALKHTLDKLAKDIQAGTCVQHATDTALTQLDVCGLKPDYIAVRSARTLAEPTDEDSQLVILAAAYLGKARLIDNLEFSR